MIKEYYFDDWDDTDMNAEYEIMGEEYGKLIEACFRYSKYFSFDFKKSDDSSAEKISDSEFCPIITLEKKKMWHRNGIAFSEFFPESYMKEQYDSCWERKYYLCNQSTKTYLMSLGCVFEYLWQSMRNREDCPENLVFYRSDDTVLLSVITHEGMCSLYLRQYENFEDVLKNPQWKIK